MEYMKVILPAGSTSSKRLGDTRLLDVKNGINPGVVSSDGALSVAAKPIDWVYIVVRII